MVNKTIKLGVESCSVGSCDGSSFNDLDRIAEAFGQSKEALYCTIKDIHVEKINIACGSFVDSLQFSYRVTTDTSIHHIEGNKHGGEGGSSAETISFEPDEFITNLSGKCGFYIDNLSFKTFIPSRQETKNYGPYGGEGGDEFNLRFRDDEVLACILGKYDRFLNEIGVHKGIIKDELNENFLFRVKRDFTLKKPLLTTLTSSWDKIQITDAWAERIAQAFRSAQLLIKGANFPNKEAYQDFKRFTDLKLTLRTGRGQLPIREIKVDDSIPDSWENICEVFRQSRKVFGRTSEWGGRDTATFQNQSAYEFLKKYLGNQWLTVKYFTGQDYPLKEFNNDVVRLNDEVELVKQTPEGGHYISKL
ncbi:jacalin-related lectin 3 isoform X1 [Rhizophagus clarus]|uniref:Jacalin-related lectin 3 isoform X1 n=1 Tax=Rhizophagus clarus TaxID=94130 RepID=A0A8H3MA26_9GLOM|nr:jacalin-related lectin 3 isoform X1 [Rhizophagus clarus]